MKRIIVLLIIILFPVFSCTKEDLPHVCAYCQHKETGYVAEKFCDRKNIVDAYVEAMGQEWECVIE